MTEEKCNKCGRELEYSKLLDCLRCPDCTDSKLATEFFFPRLVKLWSEK